MMDLTTNIYGGFIPIAALIDQCIGIRVERVAADNDYMYEGLKIMGTLVPRTTGDNMTACLLKRYSTCPYEKIIINPPATIVIWNDGTKTVVKATKNDSYDPEKGVALCFLKKYFASYKQILKDANKVYSKEEQKH